MQIQVTAWWSFINLGLVSRPIPALVMKHGDQEWDYRLCLVNICSDSNSNQGWARLNLYRLKSCGYKTIIKLLGILLCKLQVLNQGSIWSGLTPSNYVDEWPISILVKYKACLIPRPLKPGNETVINTWQVLFYRYHSVSAIKTGRGEVIVEKIGLESSQAIEVVFGPLPDIAIRVVEPHGVRRVHVDRLWWVGGREEGGGGRKGGREREGGKGGK